MTNRNRDAASSVHGWLKFTIVSVVFFQITAATFTSLGVVLPAMIQEMEWSWSSAGLGFSVLSFMVGIASRVPSWTLDKYGTRATFAIGGVMMAIGHSLMATTQSLTQYLISAGIVGLGYTLCALVPGVAVIQQWLPERRSFAIGAYMMIGGLGGAAGPQIAAGVLNSGGGWRLHWALMSISIAVLALLCAIFLARPKQGTRPAEQSTSDLEKHSDSVYVTKIDWAFADVIRTPQFYIIVAALTISLFTGVTTNTWAVAHMGNLGVAMAVAAGALSAHALINSSSRVLGGLLATRVDPKWLLASAMVAEVIGMFALAVADNETAIILFAIGEGYGFGMSMFATTVLLLNYYGPGEAPRTMGTMYLISTIAMLGPVVAGFVADRFGGFSSVFYAYALVSGLCLIAVVTMKPPLAKKQA